MTLPDLEVQVRQAGQDRLEALLVAGDLELVVGRPPEKQDPRVCHRRLMIEEQGVLLRADDPLARRTVVPLQALDGRRLVLLRGNPHFGQNFLALAGDHGITLSPLRAAEDFPSLQWLVRAGLGVAPGNLLLADGLPAGLVTRPVRPALPRLEIHALWCGRVPPAAADRWLRLLGKDES
jgi:DNA-binding transcriptional LysR family regulator